VQGLLSFCAGTAYRLSAVSRPVGSVSRAMDIHERGVKSSVRAKRGT
jgi:hypothetical protein